MGAPNVRRAVPSIRADDVDASREFYAGFLGFDVAMDLGWIVTFASATNPTAQVNVYGAGGPPASVQPQLSIEVDDVDALHAEAVRRGVEVTYPLTDEAWGVRRFFVRDPSGTVINLLSHRDGSAG